MKAIRFLWMTGVRLVQACLIMFGVVVFVLCYWVASGFSSKRVVEVMDAFIEAFELPHKALKTLYRYRAGRLERQGGEPVEKIDPVTVHFPDHGGNA